MENKLIPINVNTLGEIRGEYFSVWPNEQHDVMTAMEIRSLEMERTLNDPQMAIEWAGNYLDWDELPKVGFYEEYLEELWIKGDWNV